MNIVVEVTQEDIRLAGFSYGPRTCPIARAMRRATDLDWSVLRLPHRRGYYAALGEEYYAQPSPIVLPKEASAWVRAFDDATLQELPLKAPPPFRLSVPDRLLKKQ